MKKLSIRVIAVEFVHSIKTRRRFHSHAKRTYRVLARFTSLLFAMRTFTIATAYIKVRNNDHFHPFCLKNRRFDGKRVTKPTSGSLQPVSLQAEETQPERGVYCRAFLSGSDRGEFEVHKNEFKKKFSYKNIAEQRRYADLVRSSSSVIRTQYRLHLAQSQSQPYYKKNVFGMK